MYSKIKCYIIGIINEKKIKIEIDDENMIKMNNLIQYLQKEKKHKMPVDVNCNSIFYINLKKNTKFLINSTNYNNLEDLIGLEVYLTFYPEYYNFSFIKEEADEKKYIICKGYRFNCIKITNNKLFY